MRTYLEINIDNLFHNINILKKDLPIYKVMPIIKANAYGLGSKDIAKLLLEKGIKWFGVATLSEALELKEIGVENILILGLLDKEDKIIAANNAIRFPVSNYEEIDFLENSENINNVKIHIAYDTGMGRIGFDENHIEEAIKYIDGKKKIEIEGIFTHLSSADCDDLFTINQIDKFKNIVNKYDFKYKHILNSFGTINYSEYAYDLIRIGIAMYGAIDENTMNEIRLKKVASLYSYISHIKVMSKEQYIGYSQSYLAKKGDIIGTIPIGYADGLRRNLSNKAYVYIAGKRYRLVANICMDQVNVLLGNIYEQYDNNIKIYDKVEIFGDNIDICELADLSGTISYEILTGITNRVKRIYRGIK